jgi:hypothetical protein
MGTSSHGEPDPRPIHEAPAIVAAPPRNSLRCTNFLDLSSLLDFFIHAPRRTLLNPKSKKLNSFRAWNIFWKYEFHITANLGCKEIQQKCADIATTRVKQDGSPCQDTQPGSEKTSAFP